MLKIGVSITDISPTPGVQLAGYPHCLRPNEGVHDPLYVSCLFIDHGKKKVAIVAGDIFWSSKENKLVTLKEYADAMPEEQKAIYFASGESRARLEQLPQAEMVKEKGYDILFFTEEVDEFVTQTLIGFQEKDFRNVATDDLDLFSLF